MANSGSHDSSIPESNSHDHEQGSWFSMSKGDGQESYSKNSTAQKSWVDQAVLPGLYKALEHVSLPSHGPIRVADLGCSSGPNSIRNVDRVVEKLREKVSDPAREFQALFNDLPANDFNNLFQLFNGEVKGNFFAAGVPGTFYGRLFPRSTVHVFLSTMAIHYLSKVPDAVVAKDSPASNKGHWWLAAESNVATGIAYQEQASSDLTKFLDARAAELSPGGLLCFAGTRRTREEPNKQVISDDFPRAERMLMEVLDVVWHELLREGIITEEQSNTINSPYYSRTIEEVLKDVEDNYNSEFEVLTVEEVTVKMFDQSAASGDSTKAAVGFSKGLAYSFFENHLGKEKNEILWHRVEQAAKKMADTTLKDFAKSFVPLFVVALKRR